MTEGGTHGRRDSRKVGMTDGGNDGRMKRPWVLAQSQFCRFQ